VNAVAMKRIDESAISRLIAYSARGASAASKNRMIDVRRKRIVRTYLLSVEKKHGAWLALTMHHDQLSGD
jgi:hypothetical protein